MKTNPWNAPIRDVLYFHNEYEDMVEIQMIVYQSAVEQALANFWEAIND